MIALLEFREKFVDDSFEKLFVDKLRVIFHRLDGLLLFLWNWSEKYEIFDLITAFLSWS